MGISTGGAEGDYNNTINVVPLVDIMLVLLIIFIITLPVATHAVIIDLPRQTDPPPVPPEPPPPPITITVQSDGQILWNGTISTEADIIGYVADASKQPTQPEVHIQADKRAKYATVADVLFIVQRGKMEKIGFVGDSSGGV